MRFLHTADWHVGKKLGRFDRTPEMEALFDELVELVRSEAIDVVLVAGDLWDRALPPMESIRLVVDALSRLADAAGAVVAIPGNHDSPALFEVLAPLVRHQGIYLVPKIVPPQRGGIVEVRSRDGSETAQIACLPWLTEAVAIQDLMAAEADWFAKVDAGTLVASDRYSDRIRRLTHAMAAGFIPGGIGILMAHYFVDGAELGGGERVVHLGKMYAAAPQSIPAGANYTALGHLHRPQEIVAASSPARYAGSPIQLDFGERTHAKRVVVIEAHPGRPIKGASLPLRSGRKLLRLHLTIEELEAQAETFGDALLDVRVRTSGPQFGLAAQVREMLPNALMVQAEYERQDVPVSLAPGHQEPAEVDLTEKYAAYHQHQHGVPADPELLDELRDLIEGVPL